MDPNPSSVSLSNTQSAPLKQEEEEKKVLPQSFKDSSTGTDPDDETLNIVPLVVQQSPVMASSNSPSMDLSMPPKARITGDDDSVADEGFVTGDEDGVADEEFVTDVDDDESSAAADTVNSPSVETLARPKARVTGDDDDVVDVAEVEVEDVGLPNGANVPVVRVVETPEVEDDGLPNGANIYAASAEESPKVADDSKTIEDDSSAEKTNSVEKAEEGVLGSEEKKPSPENNSISGLVSEKLPVDDVSGVTDIPVEGLVANKEEVLPEVPKSIDVLPVVEVPKEDLTEAEVGVVVDSAVENVVVNKEEILPEVPKSNELVVEVPKEDPTDSAVENLVVNKEEVLPEVPKSNEQIVEVPKEENLVVNKEEVLPEVPKSNEPIVEVPKEDLEAEVGGVVEKKVEVEDLATETKHSVEVVENGVSDDKEVEVPDQKSVVLDSGDNQIKPVIEELVKSELPVEDRDGSLSNAGDSLVETKEPILLEATNAEVIEEEKVAETKILEVLADRPVSLGIETEQATVVVEEPVEPKLVEADSHVAIADAQSSPGKGEVEKDDDEKSAGGAYGGVPVVPDKLEIEPDTVLEAKPNVSLLNLADDGVESIPSNEVNDSKPVPVESDSVQEAKLDAVVAEEESKHLDNGHESETAISNDVHSSEIPRSVLDPEVKQEAQDEEDVDPDFGEDEGSVSDEGTEGIIFDGSETAEQIMRELERGSGSHSAGESSQDRFQRIDGQIVMDSDEEVDTDEEGDGKELFDSAALAALLKAATNAGSDGGDVTITSSDGSRLFSVERPAGLGSSIRSLKPAPRNTRPNLFTPSDLTVRGESENNLTEEEKKKLEKIQLIRVKFLRIVQRLGHSPEDSIAAQVLYRLVLAAGRHTSQTFSLDAAKRTAMQLEAEDKDDLDFSLSILVLGKTGVGKSATINSIFGEEKAHIDPFEPGTTAVKEIMGTIDGVKVRIFDTPGLRPSLMEQAFNQKVLSSVKKFTKKTPPDILLYVDRLDTQTRDLNDMPLLRSITATLGSSIWRSAIVTLTHAGSAPPDGPTGSPLSYEMFVGQRSHVVQQSIGQAVGDLRMMNPSLMNPVSLVENHPSCRRNREGHRVLPNGQTWKPQLLLLCYSMKILSEASSLSKPQDPFDHRKLFGFRTRAPPLPYLLSSLLQSRAHPKLPTDQGADNADSDIDLGDLSESDQEEEEDEYDQLPPFKPLRKTQIANLSKEQRKAYFDEYDYRVKLLQKKQWREELKRMREMKKRGKDSKDDDSFMGEDADQENGGPAAVPVPLPDMVLPPSFDGDNPAYRYRFLEPTSQLLARPVLDTHGWDHDCGYDGVSLEESLAIVGKFPAGVAVQITKDKKEFNIHLDSSVVAKYGENGSTLAGFDIQTIGKQLAYIVRGETKFKNLKKNKTAAGVAVTFLGENVATGVKIEDQIAIGKRLVLVGSTGTVRSQGDAAYGANLEVRLKEKDFPIDQDQSTLGLSLMKWRGDLALGANLQTQFSVGRSSKMSVRVGLNNKLSGQITVRTSSSEQLQLALVGLLPIAISIYKTIWPGVSESYAAY